jgi:pyruvate ferredoxin oxidoreductase delta subunit
MNNDIQKAIKTATIKRTMRLKKAEKFSLQEKMTWEEMPEGAVIPTAGNSKEYKTGNWVPKKLIFNKETCINCGLCWPVCPDDAIILDSTGTMVGVDYDHCKDCGLCVKACPTNPKSLYFVDEAPKEI